MEWVIVEAGDGAERRAVFGVHESQVLEVEHVHDVGALVLVNRDARVVIWYVSYTSISLKLKNGIS